MASSHYFEFLGTVWDYLPQEDQERMAEIWKGYEQIFGAEYLRYLETNLNASIAQTRAFSTERWLKYTCNEDNFILRTATLTSTQDLSQGTNLTNRFRLNLSYDDESPIELDLRGAVAESTTIEEIISKINFAFGFKFAKSVVNDALLRLSSPTKGINSKIKIWPTSVESENASEFILGILPEDLPVQYPEYPYTYTLPTSDIHGIQYLQNAIRLDNVSKTYFPEVDFIIEDKKYISFKLEPEPILWAENTYIDEETPWFNYGFLLDIYQKNSVRYLDILKGLWFAFWTGPKPLNLKKALYLLFSLPVAPGDGTVTEVTSEKITIVLDDRDRVVVFDIPEGLLASVSVGDRVGTFDPIVTGIDVWDKLNRPGFIRKEIGSIGIQRFLTEGATRGSDPETDESKAINMLEEHTFLPQISVESFITPDINLGNVRIFLDAIKPLAKTYLFQVIVGEFLDELSPNEQINIHWTQTGDYYLDTNPTSFLEEDTLLEYETVDNDGLNLDPHVLSFGESVDVEVRSFNVLIDSFTI